MVDIKERCTKGVLREPFRHHESMVRKQSLFVRGQFEHRINPGKERCMPEGMRVHVLESALPDKDRQSLLQ